MEVVEEEDVQPDYLIKIILIGDSGVGKSNLLLRWSKDQFNQDSAPTIGVEFATKTLRSTETGKVAKIQIWDTAGQERFRAVTSAYYRGAYGVLLVYDITSATSFAQLSEWLKQIKENCDSEIFKAPPPTTDEEENTSKIDTGGLCCILIGNKSDLGDLRAVSVDEGADFAKQNNLMFMETSGKEATNVDKAFCFLVQMIFERLTKSGTKEDQDAAQPSLDGKKIDITNENDEETTTPKKSNCCK